MTDALLALVPTYGLWLIAASVFLSCLAMPLPSSVLVFAAGGFAAAGDLVLWQVIVFAGLGFVLGDQAAFYIGRKGGQPLTGLLRKRHGLNAPLDRAGSLIDRHGVWAVFLSRTLLSPVGPYVSFIGAAVGMRWLSFSIGAVPGAATWASTYSILGFGAADHLTQYANLILPILGALSAIALTYWAIAALQKAWKNHLASQDKAEQSDPAPT